VCIGLDSFLLLLLLLTEEYDFYTTTSSPLRGEEYNFYTTTTRRKKEMLVFGNKQRTKENSTSTRGNDMRHLATDGSKLSQTKAKASASS
jgi:hypothetical protein